MNKVKLLQNPDYLMAYALGISILGYLIPVHSPMHHDFLVNAFSFFIICLFTAPIVIKSSLTYCSLAILSWLGLAVVLLLQPLFNTIRYPDALIFPITCLLVIATTSYICSNIKNRRLFLSVLTPFVVIMAVLTFVIQFMQLLDYQITWYDWIITRKTAIPDRLDGNFGQTNHAGYAFILAFILSLYQAQINLRKTKQLVYYCLWVICIFGMAWTKSRAIWIMALLSIVVYFFYLPINNKLKLQRVAFFIVVFLAIYFIASLLQGHLQSAQSTNLGALGRFDGIARSNRLALNERALLMFQSHPLTGVGWNNYMGESIEYAEQFSWPEIADHSHFFLTQLMAELGILGVLTLIPIIWIIFKALLNKNQTQESAAVLAFVIASVVFSCFEYPLWYFRYLVLFACFVALIDKKPISVNAMSVAMRRVIVSLLLIVGIASTYYSWYYIQAGYLFYQFFLQTDVKNGDTQLSSANLPPYGFINYYERVLATVIPINAQASDKKADLFYRVIGLDSSQYNLFAYSQFLAYEGKTQESLKVLKAACIIVKQKDSCNHLQNHMQRLAQENPAVFENIYQNFIEWRATAQK
ncbi:O-antigen ligase family protein [Moraxella atlantae]|uniref:O-antigen ligase family protein n=1 Tax=Faucicola atlantae TaxID=34059 RepID=UPI0037500D1A